MEKKETIRTVLFYLDTKLRSGGTIGAPEFTFPNNLIGIKPQAGETIRLTLQEASMEYTFFQTEEFNNKLLVSETVTGVGAPAQLNRIVHIQIGNYNLSTFIVELTRALNAGGALYRYVLEYVPFSNELRYVATPLGGFGVGTVTFNFNSENAFAIGGYVIEESMNEMMGFPVGAIIELAPNVGNTQLECQSSVPITMSPGVQNLYVTIKNSCSNYGNANVRNVFSSSNILGKIPVSSPPFSTLFFYDLNSNFSTMISNKYIDNLSLTLFNERFTKIEPRKDWTFTMKIDVVRKHADGKSSELLQEMVDMTKMKIVKKDQVKKNQDKTSKKKV